MSRQLDELLKKECPYEPWMFLAAREVLDWLTSNINDSDLNKIHVMSTIERIDYYLFNYFYAKSGLKPISKCSIEELESELTNRKENNYDRQSTTYKG